MQKIEQSSIVLALSILHFDGRLSLKFTFNAC
jgi:hypothetical protein